MWKIPTIFQTCWCSRYFISVTVSCLYSKWYPILDQNFPISIPYPRLNCSKALPSCRQRHLLTSIYVIHGSTPLGSGGLVPSLSSVCRHKDRPINAEEDWGNYFVSPFIRPVPNVELLPRRTQMKKSFRFTCRHGCSTPFVTIRSGPGLSTDRGTALFLGKTLYSHSASGYQWI